MIDEVCRYLYSKMAVAEWISLNEITNIIKKYCLTTKDLEDTLSFLNEYFVEFDESKQKVMMNHWTCNLFKSTTS